LEAKVVEGLVAFADRLLEAFSAARRCHFEALRGVPGNSVEEDPQRLGGLQALRVERLIDRSLCMTSWLIGIRATRSSSASKRSSSSAAVAASAASPHSTAVAHRSSRP